MKFALAYYLLLIYTTVIVKPLIPVAEDTLEHCFAEAYHIATVHAVYGSNHLENKVAATSDNNDNSSNKNIIKDDTGSVHVAVHESECLININHFFKAYFKQPKSFVLKIFQSIVIPPPRY